MRIEGNSGNKLEVDSGKRAWVEATVIPMTAFYCRDGLAYVVTMADDGLVTLPAALGHMLYLKNTGSLSEFHIQKIWATSDSAATYTNVQVGASGAPTGDNTSDQVFSLRSGDTATPDCLAEIWDATGTGITGLTAGSIIKTFGHAAGYHELAIDGGIILRPGAALLLEATDGAGAASYACGVEFVEVKK